jgi:hypothetical protein
MDHKLDLFLDLVQELAAALMRERIDYVVGDAVEGYNPSHDVALLSMPPSILRVMKEIATYLISRFC